MTHARCWMSLVILAMVSLAAPAQGTKTRHAIVIFKDGFTIKGKVNESVREVIYDSATGRAFPILSGNFFIDDEVRNIVFSPTNVQKVDPIKPGDIPQMKPILRIPVIGQGQDLPLIESVGNFDEKGDRTISVRGPGGARTVTQKIGLISPRYLMAVTVDYRWNPMYFTQEFGPKNSRAFLVYLFGNLKEFKDLKVSEKQLKIAAFMQEAGWFKEAERELASIVRSFPDEKKVAEEMLAKIKKDQADLFVESIEQAKKAGQHLEAIDLLERYEEQGYEKVASPKYRSLATDLKVDYDRDKLRIEQARKYLKLLAKSSSLWKKASAFVADELNYDTVDRLEEFLRSAPQFELEQKDNRKLSQSAEQVLAIAVSSWLQGKQAFETDPALALKLVRAREFFLEYLKSEGEDKRPALLSEFKRSNDLPMDVLVRLLRSIPPPCAHDPKKLDTEVQTIELTSDNGGSYLVQLPPGYHHQRAYPVLMVLHSGRDSAEDMLKRVSEEGAKYGFILVAPQWAGKKVLRARYKYSAEEHALVLDTLRDLRRRFQVDSDRVFLFGWEEGASMAIDVALGHPDQFAGVVSMNGALTPFARRYYWPNAQYVPFYVIEGEGNVGNAKMMREVFKDNWTRAPFTSMYMEYRGRGSEWFGPEVPLMFNWLNRKKRHTPTKEMGRSQFGSGVAEEFRSSRSSDNRFYWLSSDALSDRCLNSHKAQPQSATYQPATFQATLSLGNKSKKGGAEDIWNQISVRAYGMNQATLWITPEMMDLKHELQVYVNGQPLGLRRLHQPKLETLLEDLYQTGDRQRLFVAKIDLKW